MDIENIRNYCLDKPMTSEGFPFDEHTLVFKVCNKMFALIGLNREDAFVNLKCDPEYAIELREKYEGVQPGYHMNKKHWNSVYFFSDLDDSLILELVDHSYNLIIDKLPKKQIELYKNQPPTSFQ